MTQTSTSNEQKEVVGEDENENFEFAVLPVGELEKFGISASDVKKLTDGGIHTIKAVTMATDKALCEIKGLSDAKVKKIKDAVLKIEGREVFVTAKTVCSLRDRVITISTGSTKFDEILGGGVETMSITEAFGEFRTGKTQLCHTLCVTAQLPKQLGGGEGKVIYIDTEGTFRPKRIKQIATRFGLDENDVLENILYARAYNYQQQEDILIQSAKKMVEEQFSLIIIDSIMALFRTDFSGRGELSERQQKLGRFMAILTKIAEQFNVAAFITNQVMSDPSGTLSFAAGGIRKPIGGHVLAHASTTRLYLRKGRGNLRIAKIYDSPHLPEAEAEYQLGDGGIDDEK